MGYCFACKKRAQGAQVFKNVQVLRKQIKNKKELMQYLNTSKARYGSETPWALSPDAKQPPQQFW